MHALIVHAHPEPTSFTAALKDRAVAALTAAGHTTEVSDLYAERFDPVGGRHDFLSVADPDRFHYQTEQEAAARAGTFAPDLAREQDRVRRADALVFTFPLWWGGMPAILKGWADRVLAYGFAYVDGRRFEDGLFKGRRAVFGIAAGGTRERFSDTGVYGGIDGVLHPIRRTILEYMGYEVRPPFVAYGAPRVDDARRRAYLDEWAAHLLTVFEGPFGRPADEGAAALDQVGAGAWKRTV